MKYLGIKSALYLLIISCVAYSQDAQLNYLAQKNAMVPMRDGINLATEIYFPLQNGKMITGKYPVIFITFKKFLFAVL